jgi:hypothetical protein
MTKSTIAFLLTALAAAGCGNTAPLAELTPNALEVNVFPDHATARVTWPAPPDGAPCPGATSKVRATFDGAPMDLVSQGGDDPPPPDGDTRCDPSASFVLMDTFDLTHARPMSDVVVTDSSDTVTASFAYLEALRVLSPIGDDKVSAGETVHFRLTPTTDTASGIEKLQWVLESGTRDIGAATINGSEITAPVPHDARPGDEMSLGWGQASGVTTALVTACDGVASCVGRAMVRPEAATVHVE